MQTEQFDAILVGSGQGGTPLTKALAEHGWKTALVERSYVDGVCTNDGCTPTKTMAASARVAALTHCGADFGVECEPFAVDFGRVIERSLHLAVEGRKQIEESLGQIKSLELIFGEANFAAHQPEGEHQGLECSTSRRDLQRNGILVTFAL